MASVTNLQMGACDVSFNGTDLGHTLGGVVVTYEPEYVDFNADLYGKTATDKHLSREKLTAKVPLAEYTIANLKVAMPQGEYAGAANARLTIGAKAGKSALSDAAQLVLHPSREGTRRHDVVFYKAVVTSSVELAHKTDEQKVIEVTFEALIDESKADGNYLGLIGDSTA